MIELLIAVVLLVTVVSSLALLVPAVSKSRLSTRLHATAQELATSRLEELQARPYPLIDTTYDVVPAGPGGSAWYANGPPAFPPDSADTCDCATPDFSLLTTSDVVTANGHAFSRYWCVASVQNSAGSWHPYCTPPSPVQDQYKDLRVWVKWEWAGSTSTITLERTMTRF